MISYYVLFPNHDNGMRLYREMKENGLKCTIAPTPREASKCCGISLLVKKEDLDQIRQIVKKKQIEILQIAEIKKDIDPNRDRYC
nr:DUF3343 domain-containing protein [uncultured Sellimonas sp.]